MRSVRLATTALLVAALGALPVTPAAASPAAAQAGPAASAARERQTTIDIPRLGRGARHRVVEGVTPRALDRGVGHYPGTARPGQVGNLVVMGHRTSHPAPFADLDRLRRGDAVIFESGGRRVVYRVYGRRVIRPDEMSVLEPVPFRPGARPTERIATLITCHPKGSSERRLVVFARAVR